MPSTGSTKDLSTGRNLHCKRQPRLAKYQSPLMAGSTHHARYKGDQYQTTAFISSLRHEFPSFSEKNPAVLDARRRPRRRGKNTVRATTLQAITSAMRQLDEDEGKAFIAYWTEILINRVHHGAGYTAR
jgi:hypothetical protein